MAAQPSATAHVAAHQYLREAQVESHVAEQQGTLAVWYRATLTCPHPGDDTMPLVRRATSATREGALELARLELFGAIREFYAQPIRMLAALNEEREGYLYRPGDEAIARVQRAMLHRGHARPTIAAVHGAYIELGARENVTVGDVVARLQVAQATEGGGQVTLLP